MMDVLNRTAGLEDVYHSNVSSMLMLNVSRYLGMLPHDNLDNHSSLLSTSTYHTTGAVLLAVTPADVDEFSEKQIADANYLNWIGYPILLTLCTIGNLLNLVVLIREKVKSTTNCYMTAVAVADLFVLWMCFPEYIWNLSGTFHLPYHTPSNKIGMFNFRGVQAYLLETFIQLCDWVLIAFSLERLLAIVKPFSFRWLQMARTARIVIVVIFLLSCLFCLFNIVNEYYVLVYKIRKHPELRAGWLLTWESMQSVAEVIMTLFKFFILLLINLIVIMAIRRQQRSDIGKQRALQSGKSNKKYRNSNILLLSSVGLYLTTQLASVIYNCLLTADANNMYTFTLAAQLFATPFCQLTLQMNYSINFFLYLTVSKRYRKQFANLFLPCLKASCCKNINMGKGHGDSSSFMSSQTSRSGRDGARGGTIMERIDLRSIKRPSLPQDRQKDVVSNNISHPDQLANGHTGVATAGEDSTINKVKEASREAEPATIESSIITPNTSTESNLVQFENCPTHHAHVSVQPDVTMSPTGVVLVQSVDGTDYIDQK